MKKLTKRIQQSKNAFLTSLQHENFTVEKTHLPANATLVCTWFRLLHTVSIFIPAQKLLLKLCRKPIVIRPDLRFGSYSVNEIVELEPS
jgi:hypothetical protein